MSSLNFTEMISSSLNGTTLRVYRYLYREARPIGIHEVQKGLGLSSASVAHYHIKKLLERGLIREDAGGYVVDKVIFENMIRIRRSVIPFQTTYSVLFLSTLVMLVTIFRPQVITPTYVFAILVNLMAIGLFVYETVKALRSNY